MPSEEAAQVTVRPAGGEDLPEVAELYLATRAAAVPAMPPVVRTADEVRSFVSGWDLGDPVAREVWVAEDDLGLAGFAVLKHDWLDSLYVGPSRQGGGVGTMLLDVVKARRPDGFALWVFASNGPARGFYRRHGLLELEHTDGSTNEERSPDLRMAWPGRDPLAYLRREVDRVDDELAVLFASRLALTSTIQGHKRASGRGAGLAGRDLDRERAIAERMAGHAPGLGIEGIARIMDTLITESLAAWEHDQPG